MENGEVRLISFLNSIGPVDPFGLVVLFVLVGFIYGIFFRETKVTKFIKQFYGPPRLPFVGVLFDICGSNEERAQKFFFDYPRNYGPRYSLSLGNEYFFTSLLPEDVEALLTSSANLDKGTLYDLITPLRDGLVTHKTEKWIKRRKLVAQSFNVNILKDFQKAFNEQAALLVSILKKKHGDGVTFDICPYITRCTLDFICETAMGVSIEAQMHHEDEYAEAVERLSSLAQVRCGKLWLRPNFLWRLSSYGREERKMLQLFWGLREKVLVNKKSEMKTAKDQQVMDDFENGGEGGKKEGDTDLFNGNQKKKRYATALLDLLLAAQKDAANGLSDDDIRHETDTFIAAGQDTTALALCWSTFLLASNPIKQEKAREEMDEIFGDDKDRPVTHDDLSRMKYLEYCIKESLRLRPSLPFILRLLNEDITLSDGTTVPAGINFFVLIIQIHMDPKVYPNPEAFIPERFTPENSRGRHAFSYIPFSKGTRDCVGQRYAMMLQKIVLANILRHFRLETEEKLSEIPLSVDITLRPRQGLPVRLIPRD